MSVISAPNLVKLRAQRHATKLALAVYAPATLWSAQVNGAQTQGDTTITVDNATAGTPGLNTQVLIGSTPGGREYGETAFRGYSAPTLTVTPHNCQLPNDAYITIKELISPRAVYVTISASDVIAEGGNTGYTDENVKYQPLARMGAPACAYLDPVTNQATINFYGRGTAIAPGATLTTHAWAFGTGAAPATSAIQGTSGAPIAVTFTGAGARYVSYTVTDSNGKSHTRENPVFLFDRNTGTLPYTNVEISGMQCDVSGGVWRATVRVYTSADETSFPPEAQVVIFSEDYYDDVLGSIGNELYRENIKLVGYIRSDTIKKNWQMGYVEFEVTSMPMDSIWQLAGTLLTTTGTPSSWHTLKNMTYDLAVHHVLTQHTTISQICDVYLNNIPSYTVPSLDMANASLSETLRQMLDPVRSRAGFSAQGSLYCEINPQLQSLASRSVAYQISTTFADIRDDFDLGTQYQEKITSQVDFVAKDATLAPVLSLAPATPWTNGQMETISGVRVANQTESNEFAGLYEGYRNNSFADVILNWRGNYPIDCFPSEPISVTIAANQNARGVVWSNQRCWIKSVSASYSNGAWLVSSVIEKDAYGLPGIAGVYPVAPPPAPEPPPPEPVPDPIEPPVPPSPQGKGNLLYVSTLKGLAKCVGAYGTNGTDGAPVWSDVSGTLAGNALKIRWFNLDPFSVSSNDHFTAGWAMTDDGLYRVTGLPDTPVWTQQLSLAAAAALIGQATVDTTLAWMFTPSVRLAGFIMCAAFYLTGGLNKIYTLYSLDYGATWSCNTADYILSSLGASGTQSGLQAVASFHLDNVYYWAGEIDWRGDQTYSAANYTNPQVVITRAPGAGAYAFPKFTPGTSITGQEGHQFYSPYCDASGTIYADDDHIYLTRASSGVNAIRRMVSAFTPIWSLGYTPPALESVGDAAMPGGTGLPGNRIKWLFSNMFNEDYGVAIDDSDIWLTSNLTASPPTWTRKQNPVFGTRQMNPTYLFSIPVDSNIWFFCGIDGIDTKSAVGMTVNLGTTLVDISNHGGANDIDTVMSLAIGDANYSNIIVDYYKV